MVHRLDRLVRVWLVSVVMLAVFAPAPAQARTDCFNLSGACLTGFQNGCCQIYQQAYKAHAGQTFTPGSWQAIYESVNGQWVARAAVYCGSTSCPGHIANVPNRSCKDFLTLWVLGTNGRTPQIVYFHPC